MEFHFAQKVLFKHCDPAGIVFYPRYFEMLNDCVEAFFDDALGLPFEQIHKTGAVPTVTIQATFSAPSRHGDHLDFVLTPGPLGRSSLSLGFVASCGTEQRLTATSTIVNTDGSGRPSPWGADIRAALTSKERP